MNNVNQFVAVFSFLISRFTIFNGKRSNQIIIRMKYHNLIFLRHRNLKKKKLTKIHMHKFYIQFKEKKTDLFKKIVKPHVLSRSLKIAKCLLLQQLSNYKLKKYIFFLKKKTTTNNNFIYSRVVRQLYSVLFWGKIVCI